MKGERAECVDFLVIVCFFLFLGHNPDGVLRLFLPVFSGVILAVLRDSMWCWVFQPESWPL